MYAQAEGVRSKHGVRAPAAHGDENGVWHGHRLRGEHGGSMPRMRAAFAAMFSRSPRAAAVLGLDESALDDGQRARQASSTPTHEVPNARSDVEFASLSQCRSRIGEPTAAPLPIDSSSTFNRPVLTIVHFRIRLSLAEDCCHDSRSEHDLVLSGRVSVLPIRS